MNNTEFTVDISTLLRVLKKYAVVIIIFTVTATVTAFILAQYIIPKRYSAVAEFLVENSRVQTEIINVGDINAARNMVNTCARLFSTRNITQRLIDETSAGYSVDEMMKMISMGTSGNVEFLRVIITADNPDAAVRLLEAFVRICIDEYDRTIDSGRISLVDNPYSTGNPVFPNTRLFVIIGLLAGFVLVYLVVFIMEIFNTKVKAEDDLFKIYNIPVFAEVMCFDAKVKGDLTYEQ